MGEIISLEEYRNYLASSEIDTLKKEVRELIEEFEEAETNSSYFIDYSSPYIDDVFVENLTTGGSQLGPSENALLGAYYSLLYEDRKDLADLVLEILKMK